MTLRAEVWLADRPVLVLDNSYGLISLTDAEIEQRALRTLRTAHATAAPVKLVLRDHQGSELVLAPVSPPLDGE